MSTYDPDVTCDLTADEYSDVVAQQTSRINEGIIDAIKVNIPFANVLEGGTFPFNEGTEIRQLVQERVDPGYNIATPDFADITGMCGDLGDIADSGQTTFTARLEEKRGRGPLVCLNNTRFSVKNSLVSTEKAIRYLIEESYAADIRWNCLTKLSGAKFVARGGSSANSTFNDMFNGERNTVSADWPGYEPNAAMSLDALFRLQDELSERFRAPFFSGENGDNYYVVVTSAQQNQIFRAQSDIKETIQSYIQGSYNEGVDMQKGYRFTDFVHRGLLFGIDQEPLRFDQLDQDGAPAILPPGTPVQTDTGVRYEANPAWLGAKYEIGFIIAKDSFKRLVPEHYVGEGTWKFDPTPVYGELQWYYNRNDECNIFGDYGRHIWRTTRAFLPVQPHAVIPFAYQRCEPGLNLTVCENATAVS